MLKRVPRSVRETEQQVHANVHLGTSFGSSYLLVEVKVDFSGSGLAAELSCSEASTVVSGC